MTATSSEQATFPIESKTDVNPRTRQQNTNVKQTKLNVLAIERLRYLSAALVEPVDHLQMTAPNPNTKQISTKALFSFLTNNQTKLQETQIVRGSECYGSAVVERRAFGQKLEERQPTVLHCLVHCALSHNPINDHNAT